MGPIGAEVGAAVCQPVALGVKAVALKYRVESHIQKAYDDAEIRLTCTVVSVHPLLLVEPELEDHRVKPV